MTDPAKYWPGGIPAHIRCHDEPILEGIDEEIKGWQLFLEENAVAREPGNDDINFEVNQRRNLVDRWAAFEQIERDQYHNRAPKRGTSHWYPPILSNNKCNDTKDFGFCNLLVPQPLSRRNRALWAKIRVMLYRLDGSGEGPSIGDLNKPGQNGIFDIEPNAAGPSPLKPEDFYMWAWVDNALFDHMTMTRQGTVIFHRWGPDTFLADQETLDTGRLLLCHFENNGQVDSQARVYPIFSYDAHCKIYGLGHDLPEMLFDDASMTADYVNVGLDVEKPITELLKPMQRYIQRFPGDISEEQWRRDIERYAPGYLDAEARGNGLALDYDHDNFKTEDEL